MVSRLFPKASGIQHHHRQHVGEDGLPVSPGMAAPVLLTQKESCSSLENSLKYAPVIVLPVASWSPVGTYDPREGHGVPNNRLPAELKLSSEKY